MSLVKAGGLPGGHMNRQDGRTRLTGGDRKGLPGQEWVRPPSRTGTLKEGMLGRLLITNEADAKSLPEFTGQSAGLSGKVADGYLDVLIRVVGIGRDRNLNIRVSVTHGVNGYGLGRSATRRVGGGESINEYAG